MKIYIDSDFKCHAEYAPGLAEAEVSFFDGKCRDFIEGYRYIPEGKSWVREDGEVFYGEMASPWKPSEKLTEAQIRYELEEVKAQRDSLLDEMQALIDEVLGGDGDV